MINTNPLSGFSQGIQVNGWVLIQDTKVLTAKNGNPYIRWEGLDAASVKVWGTYYGKDQGGQLPRFEKGAVVTVIGSIGEGVSGAAVWAQTMAPVLDQEGIAAFKSICYPSVPEPGLTEYINYLQLCAASFVDSGLLQLSGKMWEFLYPYLRTIPAGRSVHEAVRGGLAKHTYEVVRVLDCDLILRQKGLHRDVLIFSALYHDIGKTQEYTDDLLYSPNGRLVSHIAINMQILTNVIMANNIAVDPDLLRQIKHCLISHHGEFSETKPATREAIALHFADNMMCKLGAIDELVRRGKIGQDRWGDFSMVLNTSPYVPELDSRIRPF